jgi:1-deoxyxylulose-5-phosphate synthase
MEHVRLGQSGLKVSRLCLGTMTFGLQCNEEQSRSILSAAADAGITFLDTSDAYPVGGTFKTVGQTEEILGRWLKGQRDDYIVATKGFVPMSRRPWDGGNSRKHLLDAIDASLRRLGTDYVDLYQLHGYDPDTPIDETLDALNRIVESGKARYVGVSNWLAYHVARALGRSDVRNLSRFITVQPRYNLLFREIERELLPMCHDEGLGVISYNPLAGGLLTAKHKRDEVPEGTRFALGTAGKRYQEMYWHDQQFATIERLRLLASEAGISMATMAIAWVMSNPTVSAPIVGASQPEQLVDAFAALEFKLDADLKASMDELTVEYRRGDSVR